MNQQHDRIVALCEQLKLDRLGTEWPALAQDAANNQASFADFLEALLTTERSIRAERQRITLTRLATMPSIKTLEQFDWSHAGGAPKAQIHELAHLAFVQRAENVVLLGPSGVGKTHIAVALAHRAVMAGTKTRFIGAADLMLQLAAAKSQGRLKEYFNRAILGPKLLVVDEIGYLPLERQAANLLFALVARRYERGSIIVTSNRGFEAWGEILGDAMVAAALIDRLIHHAQMVTLKGKSYRLKERGTGPAPAVQATGLRPSA